MFWMRTAFYKFQFAYPIFILITFPERWKALIIKKTVMKLNAWIRSSCRDMMQSVVNVKLACGVVVGKTRSTFRNNENNWFSKWYRRCKMWLMLLRYIWSVGEWSVYQFIRGLIHCILLIITSLFNDLLNKIFFTYYFHDFPKQDQSLYLCIC
jgi:hypothetical protein